MKTIIAIVVGTMSCMSLFAGEKNPIKWNGKICMDLYAYGKPVNLDEKTEKAVSCFLNDFWKNDKRGDHEEKWTEPIVAAYSIERKAAMTKFRSRIPAALRPLPEGKYLEVVIEKKRETPVVGGGTFHLLIDSKSSKVLCFFRDC